MNWLDEIGTVIAWLVLYGVPLLFVVLFVGACGRAIGG